MNDERDATPVSGVEFHSVTSVDGRSDVVRGQYSWESIDPSTAVIETVAAAIDRDPTALDPLYEVVDSDALNVLIESSDSMEATDVSFRFAGQNVTVSSDGEVIARPATRQA